MTRWLSGRLLQACLVMIAMSIIVFLGVNVIGNPVDILVSPDASQAERAAAIAHFGLDKPLWAQYFDFVRNALSGDLGRSYVYNSPALGVIIQRMPATFELALAAMFLAVVIGIPLGLYAGLRPDGWPAKVLMTGSVLGFSLPTFWVGMVLIMVFSVQLGWLPASGRGSTVEFLGMHWSFLTRDGFMHLILPALNLSLFKISLVMRLTRAGVQDVLPQDYIRYARARGMTEKRVIWVHVLKNIMIPVVTIVGLEFGSLIAFSVVTETIFAWPGMGKLIIDSINVLDRPVVVAYLMIIVALFVLINLLVDIAYAMLDPRVRLTAKGAR